MNISRIPHLARHSPTRAPLLPPICACPTALHIHQAYIPYTSSIFRSEHFVPNPFAGYSVLFEFSFMCCFLFFPKKEAFLSKHAQVLERSLTSDIFSLAEAHFPNLLWWCGLGGICFVFPFCHVFTFPFFCVDCSIIPFRDLYYKVVILHFYFVVCLYFFSLLLSELCA